MISATEQEAKFVEALAHAVNDAMQDGVPAATIVGHIHMYLFAFQHGVMDEAKEQLLMFLQADAGSMQ